MLYLYYSLDNRPAWYRVLWRLSDSMRAISSRAPYPLRAAIAFVLAAVVYWPCARIAALVDGLGGPYSSLPLAYYRRSSFYTMATDALDRFGTRLERRFSKAEIEEMMAEAGLEDIRFRDEMPFWVAVGVRRAKA